MQCLCAHMESEQEKISDFHFVNDITFILAHNDLDFSLDIYITFLNDDRLANNELFQFQI